MSASPRCPPIMAAGRTVRTVLAGLTVLWAVAAASTARAAATGSDDPAEPRFTLEAIRVEPAEAEITALVERALPLRIGQTVTAALLVETRDFLDGTGLFAEVDVYTERGRQPGAIVVVVAARRAARVRVETGLGFEPRRSWYLNLVGVRVLSPFGNGGRFRAGLHEGLHQGGLYLDLDVPAARSADLDFLADAGIYKEIWDVYDGEVPYYQEIRRVRLWAGLRRQLRDDLSVLLWTGPSGTDLDNELHSNDDDAPDIDPLTLVPALPEQSGFWESRLELRLDRRDQLRPWQAGHWVGWSVSAAACDVGPSFWGSELDAQLAVPVAGTRAAAFRFRTVYAGPGTPYYMRPILGGVRSLRGFRMGSLSGPEGARAIWQFTGEWRQPLLGDDPARPRVTGTLFADIGQHWDPEGARQDVAASVGYGALVRIRWIQTLNLEVAYPLTDDLTGNPVTFYISLGRSF